MVAKKQWYTKDELKFCDIWQKSYLYHILKNENFKMEVEETIFWDI